MRSRTMAHPAIPFAIGAYFLLVWLVGQYHILHGDEAMWVYQASLVRRGMLPSYDFFTQQPWGLLAPLAGFFSVFSQSLEADRLMMALMAVGGNVMVTAVMWRHRGGRAAAAVFSLLALNVDYMSTMAAFNSMAPSIFALVAVWFCLVFPRRADWRHYAVAGLFLGFAIASRLPMALAALVVVAHAMRRVEGTPWRLRHAAAKTAVAGLCALIMCLPDLWILSLDPAKVLFARVLSVNEIFKQVRGLETSSTISTDIWPRLQVVRDYFIERAYFAFYQNMIFPLAVTAALALSAASRLGRRGAALGMAGPDFTWSLAFLAATVAGYSVSWILLPSYFVSAYPFFAVVAVICGQAVLKRAVEAGRGPGRAATALVVAVLAVHGLQGILHGAWQLGLRRTGSMGQPLSVIPMGCWLERATDPGDRILDFGPVNTMIAGRQVPDGFEPAAQMKNWFWLDPKVSKQIHAISLGDFQQLVRGAIVPVVIDSEAARSVTNLYFPDYRAALERNYRHVGSLGGGAPQHAWVERRWLDARGGMLPAFPADTVTRANLTLLRTEGKAAFAAALADDLADSLRRLPRDVAGSLARLFGADWDTRCGQFMSGNLEKLQ